MDAFYASVEQRDNSELRGKPVAVGGSGARGVLTTASYEARVFGIRSAMPSVTAARKCPDLIFVKPRFEVYRAVSQQIREIFAEMCIACLAGASKIFQPDATLSAEVGGASLDELLSWSSEPGLLPRVPAGGDRGKSWDRLTIEALTTFLSDRDTECSLQRPDGTFAARGTETPTRAIPAQQTLL
jgi:hypothetical protein